MAELKRYITVRFEQDGFHHWPQAPKHMSYLAQVHRHMFKVEVTIQVLHNEREIEMHNFKRWCREKFFDICPGQYTKDIHHRSCEEMAEMLLDIIEQNFGPDRYIKVVVSEDGENDGIVELVI